MNVRTTAVVFGLTLALLPAAGTARAADAKADASKQAGDADALIKQIEDLKPPRFDKSKRQDQAYMQSYIQEVRDAAERRVNLAEQFLAKYPDHPRKADALYYKAETLMRAPEKRQEFADTVEAFVQAAPEDERGARLLMTMTGSERDAKKREQTLRRVIELYPTSSAAASAKGQLRQNEGIGKPFALEFTDANSGKKISMADLKGKVVVIDFWATWCGPCVAEMPKMKELYAKYKDKGVEFIGVSLDQPEEQGGLTKLKEFVAEKQIPWPQYYQGKGWDSEFSRSWGINGIPTLFIVDADGKLHSTRARGQLEELIPQLLAKRGQASAG